MTDNINQQILRDGLWANNPGLVQMLGLCPLLAVSSTLVNGLTLGLATTMVLTASNGLIASTRRAIPTAVRIPVFVLLIASLVTIVEMLINAYLHDLYGVLGIFVPLIVTNCAILGRAEVFAYRAPVAQAALDGLAMGGGFTLVLVALGGFREVVSQGTLLAGADMLLGPWAQGLTVHLLPHGAGFLLAALPPGAFFALALMIAGKRLIDRRYGKPALQTGAIAGQTEEGN